MKRTIVLTLVMLLAAACGESASTDPTDENAATTTGEETASPADSAGTATFEIKVSEVDAEVWRSADRRW